MEDKTVSVPEKANIDIVIAVINTLDDLHFPVSAIRSGNQSMQIIMGCCNALQDFVNAYKAEQKKEEDEE